MLPSMWLQSITVSRHLNCCCALLSGPFPARFFYRLLKAFDLICLTNAVFTSFMLIRTFGTGANSGMSWHYQLPMLLYGVMNVTQLSLLLLKPNMHQAYRFQVGAAGKGSSVSWGLGTGSCIKLGLCSYVAAVYACDAAI